MKGKRLPELVCGELDNALQRLSGRSLQNLLVEVSIYVSASEWDTISQAFDQAKALMSAALLVKFDYLRRLPWALAALAHPDEQVAKAHARRMINEFDTGTEEVRRHHHPKTLLFLSEDGPLRADLQAFATGGYKLVDKPALLFHCAVFRFVNIVERFIEGRHAIMKRANGRSGSALSLALRLPELVAKLQLRPGHWQDLIRKYEEARHVHRLPCMLSLARHPVFDAASPHCLHHSVVVKLLRELLYRCDIRGQYTDVRAAARHHEADSLRRREQDSAAVALAAIDMGVGGGVDESGENSVIRSLFVEHVRKSWSTIRQPCFRCRMRILTAALLRMRCRQPTQTPRMRQACSSMLTWERLAQGLGLGLGTLS